MADVNQRVACKAVITVNGKVLVLREASTYQDGTQTGRWHCPGGRINPGEQFLGGLKREVMEETGLTVVVDEPFYVGEWFPVIQGVPNQIIAIFFACSATTDQVKLSEEHDAYRWVTAAEAAELDIMPPEHEVLNKFFERKG